MSIRKRHWKKKVTRRAVVAAPVEFNLNDPLRTLRPKQLAAVIGVHVMTVFKWAKDPTKNFPQPFKIGTAKFWRATDIKAWLDIKQQQSNAA